MTPPRSGSAPQSALAALALAVALAAPAASAFASAAAAFASPDAGVVTAAEYVARVQDVRRVAASAAPGGVSAREASDVSARVAALLPDGQRVSVPGGEVAVDASVVGALASQLGAARTDVSRERALEALRAQLDSLAGSAEGLPGAGVRADVRSDPDALRELLARHQGGRRAVLGEEIAKRLQQALEWIADGLGSLLTPARELRLSVTAWVVTSIVLAAFLAFVAWRVAVALRASVSRRRAAASLAEVGVPVVAAAEGLPDDALAYAEELAAAGRYREAVRALFGGAARALVEEGLIAQTRTRTDSELLAEVEPVAPSAHPPLALLTRAFEFAWYGHADPGRHGFDEARGRYVEVLSAVAA